MHMQCICIFVEVCNLQHYRTLRQTTIQRARTVSLTHTCTLHHKQFISGNSLGISASEGSLTHAFSSLVWTRDWTHCQWQFVAISFFFLLGGNCRHWQFLRLMRLRRIALGVRCYAFVRVEFIWMSRRRWDWRWFSHLRVSSATGRVAVAWIAFFKPPKMFQVRSFQEAVFCCMPWWQKIFSGQYLCTFWFCWSLRCCSLLCRLQFTDCWNQLKYLDRPFRDCSFGWMYSLCTGRIEQVFMTDSFWHS